jgi:hypothetical protein
MSPKSLRSPVCSRLLSAFCASNSNLIFSSLAGGSLVAAGGGDPSDSCCAALTLINGTYTTTSTGGPGAGCGPVGSIVPNGDDFTAFGAAAIGSSAVALDLTAESEAASSPGPLR